MFSSYLQSLFGGALIGLAAGAMLLLSGRITGVSGIAAGLLAPGRQADRTWRLLFLAGLLAGGLVIAIVSPGALAWTLPRSWPALAVAGVLGGIGRLSPRSIVATGVFMAVAMLTTAVVTHAARGAL